MRLRDLWWVRAVLRGDKERAERWVTREYPRVYRMLRYLTGDREAAEDLTQQAFVQAWQSLASYRGESGLSTWLHRIAYRQYTHWLRTRKETLPLSQAPELEDPRHVQGLTTILVQRALQSLSDELREPFLLYYARQMSIKEVADVLEIPAGTVKSRLFTARRLLRELLMEEPVAAGVDEDPATKTTLGVLP